MPRIVIEHPAKSIPGRAANDNCGCYKACLFVPTDEELASKVLLRRIAVALNGYNISRREFPGLVTNAIYSKEYRLLWRDRKLFLTTRLEIEEDFGPDQSFRWFSDLKKFIDQEPRQKPQGRILPRLRLIVLFLMIEYPEGARALFL